MVLLHIKGLCIENSMIQGGKEKERDQMHTADMLMGGACHCKQHLFGREVSVTQHVCNSQPLLGLQLQGGIFTSADKT